MADTTSPGSTIVDELIVKLGLDASDYEKADRVVRDHISKTEKHFEAADKKDKRRAEERKKRFEGSSKAVRNFTDNLMSLGLVAGAVLGVGGGAAGLLGMLAGLTSTESAMRRATVATGLSVRQLQAWKGVMGSLTGDAEGGANAVTGLARELTAGRLTGNMPTVQAFAATGVGYKEGEALDAFLGRAQQNYRAASPGQQGSIEATLAARGVDANLIQLLKSKQDISATYGQKYAGASDSPEKGVDAFNSALADFQNAVRDISTTLMNIVTPAVQAFGQWLQDAATRTAQFSDEVKAAGGGIDGFTQVVRQHAPQIGTILHDLGESLTIFGQVIDVAVYGLQVLAKALAWAGDWLNDKLGKYLGMTDDKGKGNALDRVGQLLKGIFGEAVNIARTYGAAPVAAATGAPTNPYGAAPLTRAQAADAARIMGQPASRGSVAGKQGRPLPVKLQDRALAFMHEAIAAGYSPEEAAALTANAMRESGLGTKMLSPSGAAAGLFQWKDDRREAFRRQMGVDPSQATDAQVFQFIRSNPTELSRLNKAFASGGSAAELGEGVSRIYEAHGSTIEDSNRGRIAQQMYNEYVKQSAGGDNASGQATGTQYILNGPVNVQANNPQQFANGIQRAAGVQSYSSGVR